MKKRLVLVVLIIVIAGLYYLFVRKSNNNQRSVIKTSDVTWTEYRSEKDGYTLEYPSAAEINTSSSDGVEFDLGETLFGTSMQNFRKIHPTNESGVDPREDQLSLSVNLKVTGINTSLPVKEWVEQNVLSQRQAPFPSSKKELTINGIPAYYLEYNEGVPFRVGSYGLIVYYLIKDNKLYKIQGINVPDSCDACKNDALAQYIKDYKPFLIKMAQSLEL